ncbi:hypothetical protein [Sphingobium yanoikuyae]|uniref:hypothetical protein n=1 Tax=Sphingobium yanoikuyae TaxID=13690 RepID=UPI0035AE16CC
MPDENAKRQDIEQAVNALRSLSPIQVEVLTDIIANLRRSKLASTSVMIFSMKMHSNIFLLVLPRIMHQAEWH